MSDILEFRGETRWLSNFWPSLVYYDGVLYPTVENAYQAAKFPPDSPQRLQLRDCTAREAKAIGPTALIEPTEWNIRRVPVMYGLLQQKFCVDSDLSHRLLATGDGQLVEGNNWGDRFWGVDGHGLNMLGRLLMIIRDTLKARDE